MFLCVVLDGVNNQQGRNVLDCYFVLSLSPPPEINQSPYPPMHTTRNQFLFCLQFAVTVPVNDCCVTCRALNKMSMTIGPPLFYQHSLLDASEIRTAVESTASFMNTFLVSLTRNHPCVLIVIQQPLSQYSKL